MNILITGATGYLGSHIVHNLLTSQSKIYILVRSTSLKKAVEFYKDHSNVIVVEGDITNSNIINDETLEEELIDKIDLVVHAAALYDLKCSYKESFMANVVGTLNVINFCKKLKNLSSFHYMSTLAVSGDFNGVFTENMLNKNQSHTDFYAKSKYEAENLVQEWNPEYIKIRIYRPGIIVSNSKTGEIIKEDGPYYFIKKIKKFLINNKNIINRLGFLPLPYNRNSYFPIVSIDHVCDVLVNSILHSVGDDQFCTYHVIGNDIPRAEDFLSDVFKVFGIDVKLVPLKYSKLSLLPLQLLGLPSEFVNYVYNNCEYDNRNLTKDFINDMSTDYISWKDNFLRGIKKYYVNIEDRSL